MIAIDKENLEANGLPSAILLAAIIRLFKEDRDKRLMPLKQMYERKHNILLRRRLIGLPNNKIVHDIPRYIVKMTTTYLVGKPVQYAPPEGKEKNFEAVKEALDKAKSYVVDTELATDCGIFGKGVELCYVNSESKVRTAEISPLYAFVVYDDTVEHNPLFGVMIIDEYDNALQPKGEKIFVYTSSVEVEYSREGQGMPIQVGVKDHHFDAVPMNEYWNNSFETGDFEPIFSLIDAYDALQSDRLNDKQQFTDAIMILKGVSNLGTADELDEVADGEEETPEELEEAEYKASLSEADRMRQIRMLFAPSDADISFATKPDPESGNELLRKSISNDIHKLSFVPDLTDEKFAGNSSGVAMQFKILGFADLISEKENWFKEALQTRLRLFYNIIKKKGGADIDIEDIQITFNHSLPVNDLEIAQMVDLYYGKVPDQILLSQIPFVKDPKAALALLKNEQDEKQKRQMAMYDQSPFKPEKPDGSNKKEETKKE